MVYFNGKKIFFSPKINISSKAEGTIEIKENGTHDVKDYAEAVVNVPTSSEPETPTLLANFSDNSWENIIWACQNDSVPDTWNVGDKKTLDFETPSGTETVTIGICGKNIDTYADGGTAPLTFYNTSWFEQLPICEIGHSYFGGIMETSLRTYAWMIANENVKNAIRAVSKDNQILTNDYPQSSPIQIRTAEKLFLFSLNEAQQHFSRSGALDGTSQRYWLRDQANDYYWQMEKNTNYYWAMMTDFGDFYMQMETRCDESINVLFGFCF